MKRDSRDTEATERPFNPHNINDVKRMFERLVVDSPSQEWTIMNFDGRFFRGILTVRANHELFDQMATAMRKWDHTYDCRAILVGTRSMMSRGSMMVIWSDGKDITPPITLNYDSPNLNPANDRHFQDSLPRILDMIASGEYVSQTMLD